MTMQTMLKVQIPKLKEFKPIGINNKRILPHPIRHVNGVNYYRSKYLTGIGQIELAQKLYPEYRLFVPSSVDIGYLFEKVMVSYPEGVMTGVVVLRPDKSGYADRRVKHKDSSRVELHCTVIAEHGISWVTGKDESLVITDESKLKEYKELDAVKMSGVWYIQDFDKNRGVPTKFGSSPKEECNNAKILINPNLSIAPLHRHDLAVNTPSMLYYFDLYGGLEYLDWHFSVGSETPLTV